MRRLSALPGFALVWVTPKAAFAVPAILREDDLLGRPIVLVVALALVSLLPFVFMSVTSFRSCGGPSARRASPRAPS
jgi:hypothetical protein